MPPSQISCLSDRDKKTKSDPGHRRHHDGPPPEQQRFVSLQIVSSANPAVRTDLLSSTNLCGQLRHRRLPLLVSLLQMKILPPNFLERVLENSMEIKRVGRIGPGRSSAGKVLKRVVSWTGDGFTWEADPRLLGKLLKLLNLTEGKGATVPGAKDIGKDDRDAHNELEYAEAKVVQAAAGLEQYIALDRPDIAYSVKTTLQQMSKPTKLMKLRIIKVARYLKRNPRLVWRFQYQQQPKSIDVFVDADFAARETMLRSTSGVVEFYGRSPIEFGSSTQSVRALSTGESEFYAITKGSAHSLHRQAILKGFGVVVEAVVLSDASAGIGIASRQGCGRLEHLEVKWLWVQEKVPEKALRLRKHPTETNIADLATKFLSKHRMEMLLTASNLVLIKEGEGMMSTS